MSKPSSTQGNEIATLGGGCFWCLEAAFDQLQGVHSVESGYMGGKHPNPTYEAVCTGASGHAEVVQGCCFSKPRTDNPARLRSYAAIAPAGPMPTTITSNHGEECAILIDFVFAYGGDA